MKDLEEIKKELKKSGYTENEIIELIKDKEKLKQAIECDLGYFVKEIF